MLTVQPSSGLYLAVQYDGTNGPAIAAALRATDYQSSAGVISFKAFIMRAGGLLTSGHQFAVPLGYWVVWADEGNPYVIAPPLTTEAFAQQYQVAASAAEVAALAASVTALGTQVTDLDGEVSTLAGQVASLNGTVTALSVAVVNLGNSLTTTNTNVAALGTALSATNTNVASLTTALGVTNTNVTNLDAAVHNINAAWITSGILPAGRLAGTIAENATVVLFNRPTLTDPPTAADCWQWLYAGNRTVYGNEYNLLRVRGIPIDQVVARFMSNVARDGLATAILQASLSNATSHLFQVLGNGDIQAAGSLSMLPTAPVGVTYVAAGMGNAATINDGNVANTGAPYALATVYTPSDNRVWIDGACANTGASIPAQTTLFTVAAAHRPTAWVQGDGRLSNNTTVRWTVKGATGAFCVDQAVPTGATLSVDGQGWRKS